MTTIVAQIAPQRSTQYAHLATDLAPHELRLSRLGQHISDIDLVRIGSLPYLQFDLPNDPSANQIQELDMLSMTSATFILYQKLGRTAGPLMRPLEPQFEPALPPELVMTRRYRGKTNEMFTHFLCNVARYSSQFADQPWREMRVFDPLAGGGTTLFTALVLGADVAGVEGDMKDVETTAGFLRQFMREHRIACQVQKDRLKKVGHRWRFTIGRKKMAQQCLLAQGDTTASKALVGGFKPHLIVADLPYGIQHRGQLARLLTDVLPLWAALLPSGGAMALAWESTRFAREEMIALVEAVSSLRILNQPPYDALAHRVDRVIKRRDVLVARK